MNDFLKDDSENSNEIDPQMIDSLYQISAEIMSTNKTNTKVDSNDLETMWDIEDLILFFKNYMKYLESIANSKN